MAMGFEAAHSDFIQNHIIQRTGERRGRLERGHREAEMLFCRNVWWPLRGNFNDLHPEFEVLDWRGISYFCDFAWLPGYVKLIILIRLKKFAFQHREGWMKLGPEERSVRSRYVSTGRPG